MALTDDLYFPGRDQAESTRLEDQHQMVARLTGYVIHPTIMAQLPSSARVADVAAGTGAWALHAADLLPETTHFVAFDISSAQFPSSRPATVDFVVADARQPFPETYWGTFDLVHIAALVAGLRPSDWDVVMRNVVQLLKPGGAVQWGEGDFSRLRCLRGKEEYARAKALPKLLQCFDQAMAEPLYAGFCKLSEVAVARLDDVEVDVVPTDRVGDLRGAWTRQLTTGIFAWAEKVGVWLGPELDEIKENVAWDIDNGFYLRQDIMTVIGRKPYGG